MLRNAVAVAESIRHACLPRLLNVIESPDGPMLVYEWAGGELLGVPREERSNPLSPYQRFRALPPDEISRCLDQIYELHRDLSALGWIAVDFYDGSLIYDFDTATVHVVDLDSYHLGPFVNRMGRMFGSTRFMSPEEFEAGALIDERSNVFMLGRTILELLSDASGDFRGSPAVLKVAQRAVSISRRERYPTVAALWSEWGSAYSTYGSTSV